MLQIVAFEHRTRLQPGWRWLYEYGCERTSLELSLGTSKFLGQQGPPTSGRIIEEDAQMKIAVKAVRRLIGLGVVAGLCYSASALVSKPVYASGCNCSAEQLEAEEFCLRQFGSGRLTWFVCDQSAGQVAYVCLYDSNQWVQDDACNDD
jgi:hypothetical protein